MLRTLYSRRFFLFWRVLFLPRSLVWRLLVLFQMLFEIFQDFLCRGENLGDDGVHVGFVGRLLRVNGEQLLDGFEDRFVAVSFRLRCLPVDELDEETGPVVRVLPDQVTDQRRLLLVLVQGPVELQVLRVVQSRGHVYQNLAKFRQVELRVLPQK